MNVATALRLLLALALVAVLGAPLASAQTAGKLSGRIVDEAGAPLVGASVFIVETSRGATADLDGYYTILSVPAGTYTVRISSIGFSTQLTENVNVDIDQTTTLNATLQSETTGIEEIIVRAERPPVEVDVSNSRSNIGSAEIAALPVASIENVVQLQAGVQDGFEVRGSGADQISFQVNGLTLRDERNNAPFTNISLASVEEVQVQTGGFNAEYGNVRSAVVNVVTKEGDPQRYEADVRSRFSPPAQKNFGGLASDLDAYWIRPFTDPTVAFTGTENGAWDPATRAQYPSFEGWNSVSAGLLSDNDPSNDLTPQALHDAFLFQHRKSFEITTPDYEVDLGIGGPVPGAQRLGNLRFYGSFRREENALLIPLHTRTYGEQTGHLKLTSDVGPAMKLSVEGRYGSQEGTGSSRSGGVSTGTGSIFRSSEGIASNLTNVSFIDSRTFSGDYWGPSQTTYDQLGAQFSHALSATSVYQLRFNRFESRYDTNPGPRRDSTTVATIGGVGFDEAPFGWQPFPSEGVDGMRMGVGMSNARDSSRVTVYNVQGDYTAQLTRFAEIKAGLEYNLTRSRVNYARIDSFLTSSNVRTVWDETPVRAAAYGQTKLELDGMIANLGLRLDYFTAGGNWYDYNLFDPVLAGVQLGPDGTPTAALDSLLETSPARRLVSLSPRLGVSFPVSQLSKLYFNYGHFRSVPDSDRLYVVRAFSVGGQITSIADPNNPLPRTIAYELGYEQSFLGQFTARVAGYYKDVSLEPRLVTYVSRDGRVSYDRSEANSYADIRGFEVTLQKARGQFLRGFVNYTYDVRQSGYFGFRDIFQNSTTQREQEESDALRRVASSRPVPRPFARLNLDLFTPEDFGPSVAGVSLLGGWRTSFLGQWRDGGAFTWGDNGVAAPGVVNNVEIRDRWSLDLRFQRQFSLAGREVSFFADIYNALNRREMALFYGSVDGNDRNAYLASLHFPASPDYSNIPGSDVVGAYRPDDVAYQPMSSIQTRGELGTPDTGTIYYERDTESYLVFRDGAWSPADAGRVAEVLDSKAYIDMPNQGYLNFLNPRDIYFGVRISL
ncbi:TonB-dependent receptor [Rubrivirga sp. IMCC43871]|uniref:TonB-dependent receptor n=1 Tax=Rubrivirga sp. IMCC43871 TaxID=3391575 RepID=UPI00399039E8